jgi:hypothetical protein
MTPVMLDDFPSPTSQNGKGNGNGDGSDAKAILERAEAWASGTTNPRQALKLFNLYRTELGLTEDDARSAAEDSIRINREVEREFAA